jgi:signal transduction histidine kinase
MVRFRLRTKLILSLVLTIAALTCATLLIVHHRLRQRARQEIYEALRNSVVTFQNFQRQREITLARSAGLLANLPNLKALMTTQHEATIQDASLDLWRLAGSDLFVLAGRVGKVMALQTSTTGFDRATAQASLTRSLGTGENRDWWFGGGHLYEVFLQPIYFGSPQDNTVLGILALGYEINNDVAEQVSRIASSQVAFQYGKTVVVSTLSPGQQEELASRSNRLSGVTSMGAEDIQLDKERFLGTFVELSPGGHTTVSLGVLKSYDKATLFLESLNRLLVVVGLATVLAGCGLVFLISHTATRPLAGLVSGVRALEKGDFDYPLQPHSTDEVAELTAAFDRMRKSLQKNQQDLLHSERLATIGRMASSISHDLRHPLTAILAYAEFLAEGNLNEAQRKDLYEEIRQAVGRMTDLIASLLEFSKSQKAINPAQGDIVGTVEQAIQPLRIRPEFRQISITHTHEGLTEGCFDAKKLERVIHNLLLNACEAVSPDRGRVDIRTVGTTEFIEILVSDNGPGIPEPIREELFQPFVSYGKDNGIGLGLAVVKKIVQDHGGEVDIATSGASGTLFRLKIPVATAQKKNLPASAS